MTRKRVSATEPLADNVVLEDVKTEIITELNSTEAKKEVVQEKTMSAEDREFEISLILKGVEARKQEILTNTTEQVTRLKAVMDKQLAALDQLVTIYTKELEDLKKGN